MPSRLAPEDLLCLLLARASLGSREKQETETLLRNPLSWDRVIQRACEHEVYPLVWRNLRGIRDIGFPAVPEMVSRHLTALFKTNAHRNNLLCEELTAVLKLLHQNQILAIPLKGLALAESLYGNLTYRVCSDIDILVPRDQLVRTLQLLVKEQSYRSEYDPSFVTNRVTRSTYEYPLVRESREGALLLEIHSGLLWEYSGESGSERRVWEDTRPFEFRSIPCLALSPEWEFLFLVVHAARHNWQGLKWLVDIHELCLKNTVNWAAVYETANELGWIWVIRQTLGICQELLGTPVPSNFSPLSIPEKLKVYPATPILPTPMENTLLCVKLAKGSLKKTRLLLRRVFVPTPRDGALGRFPGFLYYVLRPIRVGYRMGLSLRKARRPKPS